MNDRFDRNYELVIGLGNEAVIIRPPIRVVFSADKSISSTLNTMKAEIFNLRESRRLKIVKDAEEVKYIPVQLKVGYGDKLQLIFRGSVHVAKNSPELPEIITAIDCKDGGFDFINSYTSKTINGGDDYIPQLVSDMPNTREGKIAKGDSLIRPKVLVGPTMDLIRSGLKKDEYAYIDDEALHVIRDKQQVVDNVVPVVNSRTGLKNTPEREKLKVTFQTMMNPDIKIGRRFKLESKFAPHLDGIYRAEAINYSGDLDGEGWTMTVTGSLLANYQVIP